MPWICDLFVGDADMRNEEIHRMAGTSEDVMVTRQKKGVLSWFGRVERMNGEKVGKKDL